MNYRLNSKQDYIFAYDMIVFLSLTTGIPEDNIILENHSIVINDEELILHVKSINGSLNSYKDYLKVLMDMFAEEYCYE